MNEQKDCHICGAYYQQKYLKYKTKRSKFAKVLIRIRYCPECENEAKEMIENY